MALTDAQKRTLARKAAANSLEVEDLLRVAVAGDAADASLLRELKAKHAWSDTGHEGRRRVVPFGRWAEAVCRFLEQGYDGLARMAGEAADTAEFCIGVLEEVKTPESVSALLALARTAERPEAATRLADAFNQLLSFKDGVALGSTVEREVREFLHPLLGTGLTENQRASVVCALRGVGDGESVALIAELPPFKGSYAGLEKAATRQIQQRLRRRLDS